MKHQDGESLIEQLFIEMPALSALYCLSLTLPHDAPQYPEEMSSLFGHDDTLEALGKEVIITVAPFAERAYSVILIRVTLSDTALFRPPRPSVLVELIQQSGYVLCGRKDLFAFGTLLLDSEDLQHCLVDSKVICLTEANMLVRLRESLMSAIAVSYDELKLYYESGSCSLPHDFCFLVKQPSATS